ncbi:hypothetical protein [Nonlabens xiamenensis]|uniref:hypothetical protein n=1 Tax=Nonlabens xiamenensis TaxID=2341043 RepID=UPI000F60DC57|nr:hypothetical protein [Nonlabens xiamenensis]
MKYVYYSIIMLATASFIFNATKLDLDNLLVGESQIGVISMIAALCVVVLMAIMLVSQRIKNKYEALS